MRLRLVYFPVRARLEAVCLALHYGCVKYELLSVAEFFGKSWADAKSEVPFSQLPIMVVDDEPPLAQSGAIMRYVCTACVPSLTPTNTLLAARCDALYEASQELVSGPTNVNPIVNVFRGDDFATKKADYLRLAPPKLANLARMLEASGGPFFLGDTPYYCDFGLFHVLDNTRTLEPALLEPHPSLTAFLDSFSALPGVADYLDERPDAVEIGTAPKLVPKKRARE